MNNLFNFIISILGCKHGYCNKPGQCICEEGWTGTLCDDPVCREGCHEHNGHCRFLSNSLQTLLNIRLTTIPYNKPLSEEGCQKYLYESTETLLIAIYLRNINSYALKVSKN